MKLKKSDINLLIMFAGVLLAVASYFFLYTSLNEKTEVIKAENAVLQEEVNYLQELANNKQQYIDETEAMKAKIEDIKSQFPAQYLPEDEILYLVGVEENYDSEVEAIGMASPTVIEVEAPVQETPAEAVPEETAEDGTVVDVEVVGETATTEVTTPEVTLYQTLVNVDMISSYNSIKEVIKKINTDEDRKAINSIGLAFDQETGDLNVSLVLSMYSMTGTEATYTAPDVSGVIYGTNNIFNSANKKAVIEAEAKAEDEAEAATEDEEDDEDEE